MRLEIRTIQSFVFRSLASVKFTDLLLDERPFLKSFIVFLAIFMMKNAFVELTFNMIAYTTVKMTTLFIMVV